MFCLGSFRGEGSCPLIGEDRVWLASRLSPASVDLVGARLLLAKQPLEEFHHLHQLGLPTVESPAGYWRSRHFSRSRPFWLSTVEIPRTSAGRWLCPWPTRIVIPKTLTVSSEVTRAGGICASNGKNLLEEEAAANSSW
jgi:hypothetical protein